MGTDFEQAVCDEIISWRIKGLEIYRQAVVGSRFVGAERKVDIVLKLNDRTLGVECKIQTTAGTTYQKLPYTIEDCKICPIPTLIVFSGDDIKPDIKTQLITSGIGIEVSWSPEEGFTGGVKILKQRVFMELGLDWLSLQERRLYHREEAG